MIKMTVAVKRRGDLSREQFAAHYRDRHGPLVRSVDAYRRHCLRYLQNQALFPSPIAANDGSEWDAVTELWYANLREFELACAAPEYMAQIRPDEIRFVNMEQLIIGIADEHIVKDGTAAPSATKVIVFRKKRPEIDKDRFDNEWRTTYRNAITATELFQHGVRRYVQCTLHSAPEATGMPDFGNYDATDEFWFDTERDAREFASCLPDMTPDRVGPLLNGARDVTIVAREQPVFG